LGSIWILLHRGTWQEAKSDPNAEAFLTLTQVDRDDSNFEDNKESVFDFVLANQLHIPLPTPTTSKEVSGLPLPS